MKIRLTKAAIRDLRDARALIAFDDPKAAATLVLKLQRAVELIGERPGIGRPTLQHATREWSAPGLPYMIPYRVLGEVVEILRFWHTSRERPKEW